MKASKILWTLGTGLVLKTLYPRLTHNDYFLNKVVVITGGSKGLGLILARQLLEQGARVAICARDAVELEEALEDLNQIGGEVRGYTCDVGKKNQVEDFFSQLVGDFGSLDIVINNAGILQVGPMESFSHEDYERAMDVMYWGIVNSTMAALPYFKEKKSGQFVNITSVGGQVSIPHMLPYSGAKFAAVGFSRGMTAELRKDNIFVTTILPWLMRTGSYVNGVFQKDNKQEFKLFAFGSTAPLLTLNAEKAAKRILKATRERKAEKAIGLQARLAIEVDHFLPNLTSSVLGIVSRILPGDPEIIGHEKGEEIRQRYADSEFPVAREVGKKAREDHQTGLIG